MRFTFVTALLVSGVVLSTPLLTAHHAAQAQFDKDSTQEITGVMKRVQWVNPHVRWYIDVDNEDGTVTTWQIDGFWPWRVSSEWHFRPRRVFRRGDLFRPRRACPGRYAQWLHHDVDAADRPEAGLLA